MVDTARTLSALQTLLADNTSGAITPQVVRDFLVSVGTPVAAGGLDTDVTKVNGGLETVNAIGNSGSSKTLAVSTGNVQTVTNSASCTYTMPSSLTSSVGISFTLIVTNNGAFTATFTAVKWAGASAPTLTSGAGKIDIFTFLTIDGGTTWYGFVGGQNMS